MPPSRPGRFGFLNAECPGIILNGKYGKLTTATFLLAVSLVSHGGGRGGGGGGVEFEERPAWLVGVGVVLGSGAGEVVCLICVGKDEEGEQVEMMVLLNFHDKVPVSLSLFFPLVSCAVHIIFVV